jgi:uncharacterized membrane protein YdjX (TVP38/TMEM64 family)
MTLEVPVTGGRLRPLSVVASAGVTLLAVAAAVLLARAPLLATLEGLIDTRPLFSIGAFVGFMVLWALTTLSAIPFMLVGGSLFGPWLGALWSLVGLMLGTLATFAIGRRWRRLLDRLASRYEHLRRILALLDRRPLIAVIVVRGVVGFPLSLLRYGLAAAGVSRRNYLVGSLVAILPGVVLYSGLGALLVELVHEGRLTAGTGVMVALALVLAAGLALVLRRYRNV